MKQFKAIACAAALALCASQSALASGIPTVDAAAIGQMVQQIVEMQKQYQMLTDQYEKMKQQYDQLKVMTSKLDGVTDFYNLLRDEERMELFSDFYEQMGTLSTDFMSAGARAVYELRGYDDLCDGLSEPLQESCRLQYAWEASSEYEFTQSLEKVRERMVNVDGLMDAISQCQTAKEIQDLQARIQGELGMIQIANIKVELNRKTLEAAIEGAKRVREARERRYFNVSDDQDISLAFE